jgi:2-succinyl-5-enolpyruvyl-6-hydroxy-3-cyclohexene-1-carboxylate synthase
VHSPCYANRGANGIDGQVSTFLGIANNYADSWAVVGDQTALYDLNALALSNQQSKKNFSPKRRIVVMNNGGGKIFSHLSYSQAIEHSQRKVLESHHRWELRGWAEMFAWAYENWRQDDCLFDRARDDVILEVFPDATQTHNFWNGWRNIRGNKK